MRVSLLFDKKLLVSHCLKTLQESFDDVGNLTINFSKVNQLKKS